MSADGAGGAGVAEDAAGEGGLLVRVGCGLVVRWGGDGVSEGEGEEEEERDERMHFFLSCMW